MQTLWMIGVCILVVSIADMFASLGDAVKQGYHLRYTVEQRPLDAVLSYCRHEKREEKDSACRLSLEWRRQGVWVSVCHDRVSAQQFPRRYYRLVLQCYLGSWAISSWRINRVFYR